MEKSRKRKETQANHMNLKMQMLNISSSYESLTAVSQQSDSEEEKPSEKLTEATANILSTCTKISHYSNVIGEQVNGKRTSSKRKTCIRLGEWSFEKDMQHYFLFIWKLFINITFYSSNFTAYSIIMLAAAVTFKNQD